MRKKTPEIKNALLFFLGSLVLLLVICIGGNSLLNSREATRKQLEAELKRLPVFDYDKETRALEEANKISPEKFTRTYTPLAELKEKVEEQLKTDAEKYVAAAKPELDKEISQISEDAMVQPDKMVEIKYYNDAGKVETIKGIYRKSGSAGYIDIGGKFIKVKNIHEDYRKMFSRTAEKERIAKINEMGKKANAEYLEYLAKHRVELEHKIFAESGYFLNSSNEWRSPKEFIDSELELRRKKIESERKEQIAALIRKYKAWGIVPFNLKITNPKS